MSTLLKKIISFCIVSFLGVHFLLIAVYSSPYTNLSNKIKFVSDVYVYPYFQQHWGLFVPTPKKEFHLYVRCLTQNKWTDWEDVFMQEQIKHRGNVALGHEMVVLLFNSTINYAYYAIDSEQRVFDVTPTNIEFKILQHSIKHYFTQKYSVVQEFELILSAKEKHNSKAYYFKKLH